MIGALVQQKEVRPKDDRLFGVNCFKLIPEEAEKLRDDV